MFNHFVNVQDSAKSVKMVTPTFRKKLCNNHAFPSCTIKSNKAFPNVDIIYYFVTVQVSAKSVKMVTTTFRSKLLQQSSSSVTMKLTKLSRKVDMYYHFVPARYPYDCVADLTLSAEFMDSANKLFRCQVAC